MKKIYLLLTFLFLNLFSQNAFSQKKDVLYEKLDLFGDILETINKEYFKQINEGEVIDGAINGMLQSLDPYSSYMSPKTFKSMNTETKGEFGTQAQPARSPALWKMRPFRRPTSTGTALLSWSSCRS